jgi:serine/threonine protein kinase
MNEKEWSSVSEEAKDFVKKLLVQNPKERMTAQQGLEHPWFANKFDFGKLDPNVIESLRSFRGNTILQK